MRTRDSVRVGLATVRRVPLFSSHLCIRHIAQLQTRARLRRQLDERPVVNVEEKQFPPLVLISRPRPCKTAKLLGKQQPFVRPPAVVTSFLHSRAAQEKRDLAHNPHLQASGLGSDWWVWLNPHSMHIFARKALTALANTRWHFNSHAEKFCGSRRASITKAAATTSAVVAVAPQVDKACLAAVASR